MMEELAGYLKLRKCNPENYGFKRFLRGIMHCLILLLSGTISYGQNVPLGIFYQAVARDNVGKELAIEKSM